MNTFMVLERFFGQLSAATSMVYMIYMYSDTKKSKIKTLLEYIIVITSFGVIYKVGKMIGFGPVTGVVMNLVALTVSYGLFVYTTKGRWYINLIIHALYWVVNDIFIILNSYAMDKLFHIAYDDEPIVKSGKELMLCVIMSFVGNHLDSFLATLVMKKVFPYKKMHASVRGKTWYWVGQVIILTAIQMIYISTHSVIDFRFMVELNAVLIAEYAASHYIYTFISNMYNKRDIEKMKERAETTSGEYGRVADKYEELRDVKHDVYNHLHSMKLLEDTPDIKEEYKEEVLHKINDALEK